MSAKTRERSNRKSAGGARQVNDLFGSSELATALETGQFKHLLDHLPVALGISRNFGSEHRIVYVNKAFEAKTGRALVEVRGHGWSILDAFRREDDPLLTIEHALPTEDQYLGVFCAEYPALLRVEVYSDTTANEMKEENYRIVVLVDVTTRDSTRVARLARQLRDKDLLLKEVQHRVKNNLQLVTVLIRLEARGGRTGEKVNLERLAGRIESLQLLYEELAMKPVGEHIDLGQYLSRIATGVMRSHGIEGIEFDLKLESVPASINVAMPVGLIVNELVTNTLKYAFIGRDIGTVRIECLNRGNNQFRIVVADNGVGLPAGVSWPVEGRLGSLIVQTLRENAKTAIEVDSAPDSGTSVIITVHDPEPARASHRDAELAGGNPLPID